MGAWTAVPFADTAARRRASSHFSVMGIPTLVIVGPDGQVLTTNGRGALARDPGGEGFPWEGAQEGVVQGSVPKGGMGELGDPPAQRLGGRRLVCV